MNTIILCLEYDGTDYFGWQLQPNKKTIQCELNRAVKKAFGEGWQVLGSGRTDTGVHASGQIAHFVYDEIKIPRHKVRLALNQKLPRSIRVKRLWFTTLEFHSRFDAQWREYRYRFSRYPSVFHRRFVSFFPYQLDLDLLFKATSIFIGKHNFFTFSKSNSTNSDYICNIKQCQWIQNDNNNFELSIIADRFVYGMVRALVGAMVDIARKKRTIEEVAFALEQKNRALASSLVPADGLDLYKIYYKPPFDCIGIW